MPVRAGVVVGHVVGDENDKIGLRIRRAGDPTRFLESLGFLSVPGLYRAIGVDYDPETPAFADHCFTGDYPTRLIDHDQNESSKERQLSLLD